MRVVARRKPDGDGAGFAHEVETDRGHTLLVDEPPEAGGADAGPSPTRLLAASLATCTAVTMEMYAARKGWDLGAVEVDADVAHEGHVPVSFDVTLRLPAELTAAQKERLLGIAARCPVHRVIRGETRVAISDRVEDL